MNLRIVNGRLYELIQEHGFSVKIATTGSAAQRFVTFNNPAGRLRDVDYYILEKLSIEVPYVASGDVRLLFYFGAAAPAAYNGWYTVGSEVTISVGNFPQRIPGLRITSLPAFLELDFSRHQKEIPIDREGDNQFWLSCVGVLPAAIYTTFEGYYARYIRDLNEDEMFDHLLNGGNP